MRLAFLLVALVANATAYACPPGPCLKYRHMQPPPAVRATATTYMRSVRAQPPNNPRALADFLTSSVWLPKNETVLGPNTLPALAIRFVDPRRDNTRRPIADDRVVLVRRIERRRHVTIVEVDGDVFELMQCRTGSRQWTSCLTARPDLSFDVPEQDIEQHGQFAKPPP